MHRPSRSMLLPGLNGLSGWEGTAATSIASTVRPYRNKIYVALLLTCSSRGSDTPQLQARLARSQEAQRGRTAGKNPGRHRLNVWPAFLRASRKRI